MYGNFPKLYVDDSIGYSAEQQTSFFNTAKCKVIHLGMKIVGHICMMKAVLLKSMIEIKD